MLLIPLRMGRSGQKADLGMKLPNFPKWAESSLKGLWVYRNVFLGGNVSSQFRGVPGQRVLNCGQTTFLLKKTSQPRIRSLCLNGELMPITF